MSTEHLFGNETFFEASDSANREPVGSFFDDLAASNRKSATANRKTELRPDQQSDVLLVTKDVSLSEKLSENFAGKKLFALRSLSGRVSELEEKLQEIKLPDILVVDLNTGSALDLDALERLKKSRFAKTPVIAISSYLDQQIVRSLMQVKVDDWLPIECLPEEVHKSCERAIRSRYTDANQRNAKCYSFFPANGGCGNTTLAVETAFLIGRHRKQLETTCLVDLNFQDGACADYLDLTPAFQLTDLTNMPGRLDSQLLDVMLSKHSSGMSVLAAPRTPGRFVDVSEGLIAAILDLLSTSFDNLIIDLPKNWHPWTDNVIWGSNRIFIVSGFTVPALRQARLIADAVSAKASAETSVSVLVNKFHEPLMGAGLTRKDAETILTGRLGAFIPNLGGVVDEAINRGMTLTEVRSGNKIEKKLIELFALDRKATKPAA